MGGGQSMCTIPGGFPSLARSNANASSLGAFFISSPQRFVSRKLWLSSATIFIFSSPSSWQYWGGDEEGKRCLPPVAHFCLCRSLYWSSPFLYFFPPSGSWDTHNVRHSRTVGTELFHPHNQYAVEVDKTGFILGVNIYYSFFRQIGSLFPFPRGRP